MTKEMNWKELTHCKTTIYRAGEYYSEDTVIPDGYEVVDYRPVEDGEHGLGFSNGSILDGPSSVPLLVVQRKKKRRIVLTEVRRGHVEEGEYYTCDVWGKTTIAGPYHPCVAPPTKMADVTAYRREDIEE